MAQSGGPPPPVYYGLSAGHKGRPYRDLAVGDVLAGPAGALGNNSAAQGAGIA